MLLSMISLFIRVYTDVFFINSTDVVPALLSQNNTLQTEHHLIKGTLIIYCSSCLQTKLTTVWLSGGGLENPIGERLSSYRSA